MVDLAIIWHQHQPLYRDLLAPMTGGMRMPWVRLHAIRDYFSMADIVGRHPAIRLTINFSPALLLQIEDYVLRGATDEAWELSRVPAERLDDRQKDRLLTTFFDADWHNQIFIHARYRALFEQRRDGRPFSTQDLRDLQVWFNLSWFGKELREGTVALEDGGSASVAHLVRRGDGFRHEDLEAVLAEQMKVMRSVIPTHRRLLHDGQIEVSVTPYFHPILPLVIDTDQATIDRSGTIHPLRFAHPEDADVQVSKAVMAFERWFGEAPWGAWPAEGAVSESVVPIFARHGIRWIASDQGVLARSGRWGYEANRPDVRNRLYRAEAGGTAVSILFRDSELSDDIGFRSHSAEPGEAARRWIDKVKERAAASSGDGVVTVVLDGENAWGAYRDDGRPFLHALYGGLERDPDIRTVTPAELLEGNEPRGVAAHPSSGQPRVYELFTGSWIDETGSAPGVDLGTWIGEAEENRAWSLLKQAREELSDALDRSPVGTSRSYLALLAAEGSDWFWWYGDDQESGHDQDFDELFRLHLSTAYRALGRAVPASISTPIVPREPVWTFAAPIGEAFVGDSLVVRTNCPGTLTWSLLPSGESGELPMAMVGGVMTGVHRHQARIGPLLHPGELAFRFLCRHPGCDCGPGAACCAPAPTRVLIRDRV